MDHIKKAMSMKTGRVAMLPPSIYNNPARMASGGWVLIETPPAIPILETNQTAPAEPTVDTLTSDQPTSEEPKKKSRKPKQSTNDRPETAE
jgi:hypothetical protein